MAIAGAPSSSRPTVKLHGHRILVCLDRSPLSEVSLPYAISFARSLGSEITLLHVMQPHHEHAGPQATDALGWEIARQEARGYLERREREIVAALGRPVALRLEQGHPAERIVDVARELGAELTVLGSHGEGGATAWNLGSTVQQVLAVARGSVFVAHSCAGAPRNVAPQRILLPLDGSRRSESVLPTASRIASAYGAELLLVHVVHEPVASLILRSGEELELAQELAGKIEASAQRYLEGLSERMAHEVTGVRTLVTRHVSGQQGLIDVAQRKQVDLIVLSAHGAGCNPERSFGCVADHLLTNSLVPLLVLQDLTRELERPHDLAQQIAPPLRASYPPEAV